jgi:cytochrome P450
MAGISTSGFTLSWAFYYLSKNKNVQDKMNEEMNLAISKDKLITFKDYSNLPYTDAVINEILRLSSTQPAIGRGTLHNPTQIGSEYIIPADTTVLLNIYAIHRNPKIWSKPDDFIPERWIDSNGKCNHNLTDSFLPFGESARKCVGYVLAKNILFSVIGNLVRHYEFDYSDSNTTSETNKMGYFRCPINYSLNISKRD